jgi:hypothetical protein
LVIQLSEYPIVLECHCASNCNNQDCNKLTKDSNLTDRQHNKKD